MAKLLTSKPVEPSATLLDAERDIALLDVIEHAADGLRLGSYGGQDGRDYVWSLILSARSARDFANRQRKGELSSIVKGRPRPVAQGDAMQALMNGINDACEQIERNPFDVEAAGKLLGAGMRAARREMGKAVKA